MLGFATLVSGGIEPKLSDGAAPTTVLDWVLREDLFTWHFFDEEDRKRALADMHTISLMCPEGDKIATGHKSAAETEKDGRLRVLYEITCRLKRLVADEVGRGLVPPGTPIPMDEAEIKQYQVFYPVVRVQPRQQARSAGPGATPLSKRAAKRQRQAQQKAKEPKVTSSKNARSDASAGASSDAK